MAIKIKKNIDTLFLIECTPVFGRLRALVSKMPYIWTSSMSINWKLKNVVRNSIKSYEET
jgi:hypothetical protein